MPLRTTTSDSGIAAGQSWLDQIRSLPLVIFTTRLSGETLKVHAGWRPWSARRITIGCSPQACGTVGTTLTSSSRHSPLGGSNGFALLFLPGACEGATGPRLTDADGSCCCAEEVLASTSGESESWPVPPSSLPIPKTRPRATRSTTLRRTQ